MREAPATKGTSARANPMNRPTRTAFPPWRAKKASARTRCSSRNPRRDPKRSSGTPQPVAELVTDVVAQRGADRRGGDHGVKIEHTLMREESGREHQTFARDQETRECGGLEGRRDENDDVAPVAEPGDQF